MEPSSGLCVTSKDILRVIRDSQIEMEYEAVHREEEREKGQ